MKVFIDGESKMSAGIDNNHSPEWDSELDMGCPSYEEDALNLQMFEVCGLVVKHGRYG